MNTVFFLFVRDSYKEKLLQKKFKDSICFEFVSLGDTLTDYEKLKNSSSVHFVVEAEIYCKNKDYFDVIKNYYVGNFIMLVDKNSKVDCSNFNIYLDIDSLLGVIPLVEKIDLLENYISQKDVTVVEEKMSLTNAYYSHIESLDFVNCYGVDIKFFSSVGKNRFSNIFWLKNRWNKILFLNIDVGSENSDFLSLMLIKEWDLFYEKNKEDEKISHFLDEFISLIYKKYPFIREKSIKAVFSVIDCNGVEDYSYNCEDCTSVITVGDDKVYILGIDREFLKSKKLETMQDVYSSIERNILKIEESSISMANKYAFVFKLGQFDADRRVRYRFTDVLDNTGVIKFFEISKLSDIIHITFEKVSKLVKYFEQQTQDLLLNNIKIVLREIIINSIEHGLKNSVCGTVYFHYYMRNNRIVFTVEDSGQGFDYDLRCLDRESRRGKGLYLIDNIVDDIYFNENGNLVRVEFNLDRWRKNDF